MVEIPKDSDLLWQSRMNVDNTEPHPKIRMRMPTSPTTETVFGMRPKEFDHIAIGDLAAASALVD